MPCCVPLFDLLCSVDAVLCSVVDHVLSFHHSKAIEFLRFVELVLTRKLIIMTL